jgi:hypothetical protein
MKMKNENDNGVWGRCVFAYNNGDVNCNWATFVIEEMSAFKIQVILE